MLVCQPGEMPIALSINTCSDSAIASLPTLLEKKTAWPILIKRSPKTGGNTIDIGFNMIVLKYEVKFKDWYNYEFSVYNAIGSSNHGRVATTNK